MKFPSQKIRSSSPMVIGMFKTGGGGKQHASGKSSPTLFPWKRKKGRRTPTTTTTTTEGRDDGGGGGAAPDVEEEDVREGDVVSVEEEEMSVVAVVPLFPVRVTTTPIDYHEEEEGVKLDDYLDESLKSKNKREEAMDTTQASLRSLHQSLSDNANVSNNSNSNVDGMLGLNIKAPCDVVPKIAGYAREAGEYASSAGAACTAGVTGAEWFKMCPGLIGEIGRVGSEACSPMEQEVAVMMEEDDEDICEGIIKEEEDQENQHDEEDAFNNNNNNAKAAREGAAMADDITRNDTYDSFVTRETRGTFATMEEGTVGTEALLSGCGGGQQQHQRERAMACAGATVACAGTTTTTAAGFCTGATASGISSLRAAVEEGGWVTATTGPRQWAVEASKRIGGLAEAACGIAQGTGETGEDSDGNEEDDDAPRELPVAPLRKPSPCPRAVDTTANGFDDDDNNNKIHDLVLNPSSPLLLTRLLPASSFPRSAPESRAASAVRRAEEARDLKRELLAAQARRAEGGEKKAMEKRADRGGDNADEAEDVEWMEANIAKEADQTRALQDQVARLKRQVQSATLQQSIDAARASAAEEAIRDKEELLASLQEKLGVGDVVEGGDNPAVDTTPATTNGGATARGDATTKQLEDRIRELNAKIFSDRIKREAQDKRIRREREEAASKIGAQAEVMRKLEARLKAEARHKDALARRIAASERGDCGDDSSDVRSRPLTPSSLASRKMERALQMKIDALSHEFRAAQKTYSENLTDPVVSVVPSASADGDAVELVSVQGGDDSLGAYDDASTAMDSREDKGEKGWFQSMFAGGDEASLSTAGGASLSTAGGASLGTHESSLVSDQRSDGRPPRPSRFAKSRKGKEAGRRSPTRLVSLDSAAGSSVQDSATYDTGGSTLGSDTLGEDTIGSHTVDTMETNDDGNGDGGGVASGMMKWFGVTSDSPVRPGPVGNGKTMLVT